MTSITNIGKKIKNCVGVGVGVAFAWAFAFACHVHAQVNISRAHAEVRVFLLQRLLVGNVELCHLWNHQA
jgi:hypothetical protein